MKRAKLILGKCLSVLMAFILTFTMSLVMPQEVDATSSPKGYVTISVEKFTLGQGYIKEPVKVPFYEGESVANLVTRLLGQGNYTYTGSVGDTSGDVQKGFYLASVKDGFDGSEKTNIPQYILDEIKKDNSSIDYERWEKDFLGEFDYTYMSGWMYCVNSWFPNYGSSVYYPKDGDVIRWQFTTYGYGMDIGGGIKDPNGAGDFNGAYVPIANKDSLTAKVGEINSSDIKEYILQDKNVKSAYNKAYSVLENMESAQSEVDNALVTLNTALDNAEEPKILSVSAISDQEYTGEEIKPSVTVRDGSKTLKSGTDYTLSYNNNKNVGTATVTVTGKNDYKGFTKNITFKIEPRKVKNVKVTSTITSVKLTWDKVSEASGYRIYRYNSKTKSYDHISTVSKNTTTSYTNTKRSSATSYTYKVRAYKTVSSKNYYGNFSDSKKITTKPLTPSAKLSAGSKKIKISWNKISNASGYEIYRATSKSGKYSKIKTVTSGSTLSYTNTKLTKNKGYYYKVRAYKTVDGKKVYSSYSSVKYTKSK